ncbi:unnamed protein product [Amoebophrya sp. A120]|nr:unnamed protein product [Amoebophrya sp. A120]|eukprot:GSA120T00025901001.1
MKPMITCLLLVGVADVYIFGATPPGGPKLRLAVDEDDSFVAVYEKFVSPAEATHVAKLADKMGWKTWPQ